MLHEIGKDDAAFSTLLFFQLNTQAVGRNKSDLITGKKTDQNQCEANTREDIVEFCHGGKLEQKY
jgi:hypothetical protein